MVLRGVTYKKNEFLEHVLVAALVLPFFICLVDKGIPIKGKMLRKQIKMK